MERPWEATKATAEAAAGIVRGDAKQVAGGAWRFARTNPLTAAGTAAYYFPGAVRSVAGQGIHYVGRGMDRLGLPGADHLMYRDQNLPSVDMIAVAGQTPIYSKEQEQEIQEHDKESRNVAKEVEGIMLKRGEGDKIPPKKKLLETARNALAKWKSKGGNKIGRINESTVVVAQGIANTLINPVASFSGGGRLGGSGQRGLTLVQPGTPEYYNAEYVFRPENDQCKDGWLLHEGLCFPPVPTRKGESCYGISRRLRPKDGHCLPYIEPEQPVQRHAPSKIRRRNTGRSSNLSRFVPYQPMTAEQRKQREMDRIVEAERMQRLVDAEREQKELEKFEKSFIWDILPRLNIQQTVESVENIHQMYQLRKNYFDDLSRNNKQDALEFAAQSVVNPQLFGPRAPDGTADAPFTLED